MQSVSAIVIDMDWATDDMIDFTAQILIDADVKATWYITHDSAGVQNLFSRPKLFEIGIHPNFLKGSTQGECPQQVMDYLLNIYPNAQSVRTHVLYDSRLLSRMYVDDYNIKVDVTTFLPKIKNLNPYRLYVDKNKYILRVPTFWEDAVEMLETKSEYTFNDAKYKVPGLKVFTFHPIHVMNNTRDFEKYTKSKKGGKLHDNLKTNGSRTFLRELIHHIRTEQQVSYTISDIVKEWKRWDK